MKAVRLYKAFLKRLILGLLGLFLADPASAGESQTLIRDAEIENTIRSWSMPIFEAADLDPEVISVYLVRDKELNAFVAGGQNIFLTTGLLMRSENPGQVIGVIAHEAGHIAGGHLVRLQKALKKAQIESIIGMILGAGAIAAGNVEAGQAVIAGGQHIAERSLLKYTRGQEGIADQAAISYLERTGQSPRGLEEFLRILLNRQAIFMGRPNPYTLTHPLTSERIANVRDHITKSRFSDVPPEPQAVMAHARMRAKLKGFIEPLKETLREYPEGDTRLEARYARAIAYYRRHDLKRALPLIDGLIAEHSDDPYFHELKGQMLFENGRAPEALASQENAVRLLPDNALLHIALGQTELAMNDPSHTKAATINLVEAVRIENNNAMGWNFLAIAYGREGHIGLAALALAEKFLIVGNTQDARLQAERAQNRLSEGTPGWLRAQDIMLAARAAG